MPKMLFSLIFTQLGTTGTQAENLIFLERPSMSTPHVLLSSAAHNCPHCIVHYFCLIEYKFHEVRDCVYLINDLHSLQKYLAHKMLKKCCCMKNEQMVMWRPVMSISPDNYNRNKPLEKQFRERIQSLNLLKFPVVKAVYTSFGFSLSSLTFKKKFFFFFGGGVSLWTWIPSILIWLRYVRMPNLERKTLKQKAQQINELEEDKYPFQENTEGLMWNMRSTMKWRNWVLPMLPYILPNPHICKTRQSLR